MACSIPSKYLHVCRQFVEFALEESGCGLYLYAVLKWMAKRLPLVSIREKSITFYKTKTKAQKLIGPSPLMMEV